MNNLTSRSVMINDDTLIFFIFWFPNIKEPDITNDAKLRQIHQEKLHSFVLPGYKNY